MSETTPPASLSRKLMIFIVLIILPATSWFYLRNGLNWRKEAVAELGSYGQIRHANILWPDGTKEDRLDGKIVVVHVFGEGPALTPVNRKIIDTGEELFKQFGENEHFRLAMIADKGAAEFRSYAQTRPSYDYATWVWIGGSSEWQPIMQRGYQAFSEKTGLNDMTEYYALADTAGIIRRYYDATDDEQVKRMVQQVAILLPPSGR